MPTDQQILVVRSLKGSLAQIALAFLYARSALDLKQVRTWTGLNRETLSDGLDQLKSMGLLGKQILAHGRILWVPAGGLLPWFQENNLENLVFQVAEIPRPGNNDVVVVESNPDSPSITTTTTTRGQLAEIPRPGLVDLNAVLDEYQVIGRKRKDLTACEWVTAEYVRAHVEYAKAEPADWDNPVGMAITRMLEQLPMPGMRENGHPENCRCAKCRIDDFFARDKRYSGGIVCETCSQYPCVCDDDESENE